MSKKQQIQTNQQRDKDSQIFQNVKHKMQDQLSCSRNDMKCWVSLLPKLPCQIDNAQCWKKQLPSIPCKQNDSECWRHLIPHLPCKVEDHQCWKDIKTGEVLKQFNPHQQKILNIPYRQQGLNPMRNMQKRYGGMVTSQNHVWIV